MSSADHEQRRVALIVVHGIGNQSPGDTADKVARALGTDDSVQMLSPEDVDSPSRTARIEGHDVSVHEANWANHSHPDNPPYVNNALGALPELARSTINGLRQAVRPLSGPNARAGLPEALYFLVLAAISVFSYGEELFGISEERVNGIISVLLFALLAHSIWFVWRRRRAREVQRGLARLGYWLWDLLAMVARPIVAMTVVFSIVLFIPIVIAAAPINILGMALTWPFRLLGRALRGLRLRALARWTHRLGWVLVVFPINSILQAVKAWVTLFSVALTETSFFLRLRTLLWFPSICLALLVLLFLCEIVVLTPLAIVLGLAALGADYSGATYVLGTLVSSILMFGPYLLLVRVFLPVLDPLLDVSNYHLSTSRDRGDYFVSLNRTVTDLTDAGYEEIHLLAHSLGTVLVIDWLEQRAPDSPKITSLHTIGSPLNKFWFVDYPLARRLDTSGLASAVEESWTNFWALSDPVSGPLRQFNAKSLKVTNRRMRWLGPFLISHNAYWKRDEVIHSLRRELVATQQ